MMVAFIDRHRGTYGVEPICQQLPIAPSTYFKHKALLADPAHLPVLPMQPNVDRMLRDALARGGRKLGP